MKNTKKLMIVLFMTLFILPIRMKALNGDGSIDNPYIISTIEDLVLFRDDVNQGNDYQGQFVELANHFDLSSIGEWIPIGAYNHPFMGSFNGNGYQVSGVQINQASMQEVGFFGFIDQGSILNLGIEGEIVGLEYVGLLSGNIVNHTVIENCYTIGNVRGTQNTGGLVGYVDQSRINQSFSITSIEGSQLAGGLIGYAKDSELSHVYHIGTVSGIQMIGGLIGDLENATINTSYHVGKVVGSQIGGLIGMMVGADQINNSFIDKTISEIDVIAPNFTNQKNTQALSTMDIFTPSIFDDINFDTSVWNVYKVDQNDVYYPTLKNMVSQDLYTRVERKVINDLNVVGTFTIGIVEEGKPLSDLNIQFSGHVIMDGQEVFGDWSLQNPSVIVELNTTYFYEFVPESLLYTNYIKPINNAVIPTSQIDIFINQLSYIYEMDQAIHIDFKQGNSNLESGSYQYKLISKNKVIEGVSDVLNGTSSIQLDSSIHVDEYQLIITMMDPYKGQLDTIIEIIPKQIELTLDLIAFEYKNDIIVKVHSLPNQIVEIQLDQTTTCLVTLDVNGDGYCEFNNPFDVHTSHEIMGMIKGDYTAKSQLSFQIQKATITEMMIPEMNAYPFNSTLNLGMIELPSGFTWKDQSTKIDVGLYEYVAIYNPDPSRFNDKEVLIPIQCEKGNLELSINLSTPQHTELELIIKDGFKDSNLQTYLSGEVDIYVDGVYFKTIQAKELTKENFNLLSGVHEITFTFKGNAFYHSQTIHHQMVIESLPETGVSSFYAYYIIIASIGLLIIVYLSLKDIYQGKE